MNNSASGKVKNALVFGLKITVVLIIVGLFTHKYDDAKSLTSWVVSSLIVGSFIGFVWYWVKGKMPM